MAVNPVWSVPGGAPVAVSADGSTVLAGGEIFSLYDASGMAIWRGFGGSFVESRSGMVSPLAITGDGMYSVLGTNGGLLYVDRSQRVFWQDSRYRPIQDLALSPDENFVASVADGRVSVYTRGGDILWRNNTYPDVESVGISSQGLLTVAGSPGTIHAYNQSGFEIWNYSAPGIGKILVSPRDSDILAASDYTLLYLHPSGNLLWKFYTGDEIRDIAISGDDSCIAAGNQGSRVFLLDKDGRQLWSFRAGNWINAVSLSGNGSLIAAGGIDREVYLLDRSGRQIWNYTAGGIVNGVAISSDGSGLAAAADMLYYFDLRLGPSGETTPVTTLPLTTTVATSLAATSPPRPSNSVQPASPSPVVPAGTTPRESVSGWLAIVAIGLLLLCSPMRGRR